MRKTKEILRLKFEADLSNHKIGRALVRVKGSIPDWQKVQTELDKKHVTLRLLWGGSTSSPVPTAMSTVGSVSTSRRGKRTSIWSCARSTSSGRRCSATGRETRFPSSTPRPARSATASCSPACSAPQATRLQNRLCARTQQPSFPCARTCSSSSVGCPSSLGCRMGKAVPPGTREKRHSAVGFRLKGWG
jgi:hypothetical protein